MKIKDELRREADVDANPTVEVLYTAMPLSRAQDIESDEQYHLNNIVIMPSVSNIQPPASLIALISCLELNSHNDSPIDSTSSTKYNSPCA